MSEQRKLYDIHTPRSAKEGFKLPRVRAKSSSDALDIFEEKHSELYYAYGVNEICVVTEVIKPCGKVVTTNRPLAKPPVPKPSR